MAQTGSDTTAQVTTRVSVLMARLWSARFPDRKPEWCGRMQPQRIQKWIMRPVLWQHRQIERRLLPTVADLPRASGADLPVDAGTVPDVVTLEEAADLRQLADDQFWSIVEALSRDAEWLAAAVRTHFAARPATLRPPLSNQQLSEWAASTVSRPYRRAPALPSTAYLTAAQADFQQRTQARFDRVGRLPMPAEFVERYSSEYDDLWERRGAQALAVLSPIALGLGELARPPMVAARNDWQVGTDKSVQQRYRRYLRCSWEHNPAATARTAGLDPEQHLSVRLQTVEPEVVCRGELVRACSPIGLCQSRHHALLRTFVAGMDYADLQQAFDSRSERGSRRRPPGRPLARWAQKAPDLSDDLDDELRTAVAGYGQYWAATSDRAAVLAGAASRLPNWAGTVGRGTARRLWNRLHQREVVWEEPVVRTEAASLVRSMFAVHLLELLAPPAESDAAFDPDEAESESDAQPDVLDGPAPDDPHLLRTMQLLHDRAQPPDLMAALRADGETWLAWYGGVLGPELAECLPPVTFRSWALRQLPESTEPAEDH